MLLLLWMVVVWRVGPTRDKMTGNKTNPCKIPKTTMAKKAKKTVMKILVLLKHSGTTAKKVVNPPNKIEAPIVSKVSWTQSLRDFCVLVEVQEVDAVS